MKRGKIFVIGVFFLWGCFAHIAYAGFGITPPYVRSETLRPGSEYTQEIIIVRSDPVEDLTAELGMNLPGIESWFSVDRGQKFTLPKGESQVKMSVTVRVPEDAKLGQYTGNIRIRTYSAEQTGVGVSLALGAQIDVYLKVVEEIYDFAVRRVEIFDAEEGTKKWWLDYPGKIKFAMQLENTGNVPAAPEMVELKVYDVTGKELLETTKNTNSVERLLPFVSKKVWAFFPTKLSPGAYRVKYAIYKNEERSVAQEGELALSILPYGTISDYEHYGFEGLSLGDKLSVTMPPGLLLLVLFGLFYRLPKRKKRRSRREEVYEDDHDDDPPPPRREVVRPRRPHVGAGGVVDLSRRR